MRLTEANPAQQWEDLEVLDVPSCARGAIRGRRPGTVSHSLSWSRIYYFTAAKLILDDKDDRIPVIPCAMADSLSLGW